jgi:hypothetical protein
VRTACCQPRKRQETTSPLNPGGEQGAWGEALAGGNERGMVSPRGVRVVHGLHPWNQAEIRPALDAGAACPARCHDGRW